MADAVKDLNSTTSTSEETLTLKSPKSKLRCIVKLGGAAITHKNELESINEESLGTVCSQLRRAMVSPESSSPAKVVGMDWSRRGGDPIVSDVDELRGSDLGLDNSFIVVHGAGSFGHFQASRSGVHKGGLHLPLVKAGFVATRISVTSLNLEIVRALAREGIPAVGMSPFACGWSTRERNIASADASQIVEALQAGFVPVLHGDAVIDHTLDCTILSGDVIIRHLAQLLMPEYVVFLTDVLGVYDRPPTDPKAILLREIAVGEDGDWSIVKPTPDHMKGKVEITVAAHDTTGGMETKILEAAVIAKLGVDVYITKAGTDHCRRALRGEVHDIPDDWLGTVIRSKRK
ncbi:uncharacterized protein A4U43_C07F30060 [Asparagus officinalis]|uniref:Isopentenyl phosphate kinase n=1 Tax=Asparagus officinalis TaxID=4686 RepID=A0A5P1EFX2_ASPOF|nr:uncharacterized protein LOC109849095 isoform X2 [Asparagus officinalis]ONK64798.1 uncharacterized protein A4U43_C07F30060 [Asparagus officinalis]